jgi:glutamate/tyrosine decarboxylase-like PLP-dependent enzyme
MASELQPDDPVALRRLAHRMLDDVLDDIEGLAEGPVWRPMPDGVRETWRAPLPYAPTAPDALYAEYRALLAPYAVGNRHPRFLGWVHGGGTEIGMLAEMLAAGLNANCGGRDHAPILCERQVVAWAAEMLGLPDTASGLLVTGSSIANFIAVLAARRAALGPAVRGAGLGAAPLTAYASAAAHLCVARAMDMAGIGTDALRLIPTDPSGALDPAALRAAIATDRLAGCRPFLLVGTAGSVDTGAIDPLGTLAQIAAAEGLWLHVDAAFGALAMLSPTLRPLFAGMERARSVAFDFHKWGQVPYDAGCIVVRDRQALLDTFAGDAAYLEGAAHGLAAGKPWPVDLGPDLSRGFRALKVWMTLKAFGGDRLGRVAERSCALARRLAAAVDAEPALERLAPVPLNIVCFRWRGGDDAGQAALAAHLQEAGSVVLSTTTLAGRVALRAAFVNHRTDQADADAIVPAVLTAARAIEEAQP